jgi:protein TonB
MSAPRLRRTLTWGLVALGVVCVATGAVHWLRGVLGGQAAPVKQVVQEVRIIRPPPPPEDQPPPPPPPPQEKVDLPEPQPEPTPSNDPPPGEQLGVDAEGSSSGDGFGLVGRPGGRDLLASAGSAYTWYAGLIKNEIQGALNERQDVRNGSYTIVVKLWVSSDGTVDRYALASSTGNRDRDRAIETALSQIRRLSQAPPSSMPQPISLRIVARA